MDTVIEVAGLVKRFGNTTALDGLELRVGQGEVHGFLGPNGAGKSTTLRILLGLVRSNAGRVEVLGRDPWADGAEIHRDVASVPGDVSLWPNLTGGEIIDLLTGLRGGPERALRHRLITDFDFDPRKRARSYSKGNRQKVALIAAFARPASLYLLDEPTSGLDPVMEAVFRAEVARVRSEGATVLLSSHILSEVEELCDRVTIIRAGVAVETGSLAELRHLSATAYSVVTDAEPAVLDGVPGVLHVRREGHSLLFDVEPAAVAEVLRRLSGVRVETISAVPPSLEELFLRHYGTTTTTNSPSA